MKGLDGWLIGLPAAPLYAFLGLWLFVESVGFPISDEPVLLLAGYLTTRGRISLVSVILIALIGKVAASCLAYWIGTLFDVERMTRPTVRPATGAGRWLYFLRPTAEMAQRTEAFFARWGVWSVFLGRLVPVVRSFISYPAGAARMPFGMFFLATTAGSLVWIAGWTILGAVAGRSYHALEGPWRTFSLWMVVILLLTALGYLLWRHLRPRVGR